MRTFVCFPPLARMTGGMAVLAQLAAHLHAAGYPVWLVPREPLRELPLPPAAQNVPICAWEAAAPEPGDIWLAPEGWPGLLLPGLNRQARVVLYVQNWAYFLSSVPPGLPLHALPLHPIAVSRPVAAHIARHTGRPADSIDIVRPGIDPAVFFSAMSPGFSASFSASFSAPFSAPSPTPGEPVEAGVPAAPTTSQRPYAPRIAWMPRKNKALAAQIRDMVDARMALRGQPAVTWVEIHHRTQTEVAELFRSCDLFVATGFPEGCPLPPLEAMACGCLVAGFSGFGGLDYMRQAWPDGDFPFPVGRLHPTPLPVDPVPENAPGNGFWVHDADTVSAACAVEHVLDLLRARAPQLEAIRAAGLATVARYTLGVQQAAICTLWDTLKHDVR